MASKQEWNRTCMEMAVAVSKLSKAVRAQVGCVVVKGSNVISMGYNGTPAGWSTNKCEDDKGVTKAEVLHAESNAIAKTARSTQSCEGATLYVTLSPCVGCAKLIIQAGITEVFYLERYHNTEGLSLLTRANIPTIQL